MKRSNARGCVESMVLRMSAEENLKLMKKLDNAWDAHDWPAVGKYHAKDAAVFWPGGMPPTKGRGDHENVGAEFTKALPDNKSRNDPYRVAFGQ
ncbi:MAG: ester cyclase [Methanomassiliicoccales archaeon]|nr:ester cyclase [Methanomassiliicoccales archaeon]